MVLFMLPTINGMTGVIPNPWDGGVAHYFFCFLPIMAWNLDPPDLRLQHSLGWQVHTTLCSCWLGWGLWSFFPGCLLCDPPVLDFQVARIVGMTLTFFHCRIYVKKALLELCYADSRRWCSQHGWSFQSILCNAVFTCQNIPFHFVTMNFISNFDRMLEHKNNSQKFSTTEFRISLFCFETGSYYVFKVSTLDPPVFSLECCDNRHVAPRLVH